MIRPWITRALHEAGLTVLAESATRLRIGAAGGPRVVFQVIQQTTISEEQALEIANKPPSKTRTGLLYATTRLTNRARAHLRKAGVSWLERETGTIHLRTPNLFVNVGTREEFGIETKRSSSLAPAALLRDRSGVVAETILAQGPDSIITLASLAEAANVSRALASRLLKRLTNLDILQVHGAGPHKYWTVTNASALLDRWADEERGDAEVTTGLSIWLPSPTSLLSKLHALHSTRNGQAYAVAGAAAANLHSPSLSSLPVTAIWIPFDVPPSEVAGSLNGQIVPSGANVRLWQTAKDPALVRASPIAVHGAEVFVVSPHRAYVEAQKSGGRGPDVAAALRAALRLPPPRSKGHQPND